MHFFHFLLLLSLAAASQPALSRADTDDFLKNASTTDLLSLSEGKVLNDNEEAYEAKIQAIRSARKTLDLVYYIYADDYTSSKFTNELIEAARRGVKVRLLVDYITNYARLDLFSMMEREGRGNLEVRLYNRPTAEIMRDVVYLTTSCDEATRKTGKKNCGKAKAEYVTSRLSRVRDFANFNTGPSGTFLSGLYSKNPNLVVSPVAAALGMNLDPDAPKTDAPKITKEEIDGLKKLAQLLIETRRGNLLERIGATLKLAMAKIFMGKTVKPALKMIEGLLPLRMSWSENHRRDWIHISDYTHHKLLLADGSHWVSGGRNIEDSYHLRPLKDHPLASKYIFMDTDFEGRLKTPTDDLRDTYTALWDFTSMVATLKQVRNHAPNDEAMKLSAVKQSEEHCKDESGAPRDSCVASTLQMLNGTLSDREDAALQRLSRRIRKLENTSVAPHPALKSLEMSPSDLASAEVLYFENLPFDPKETDSAKRVRIYGSDSRNELKSGKAIQAVWKHLMKKACDRSNATGKDERVVLNQAYFLPSADIISTFTKMTDGSWGCRNVTLTFFTNSKETTDLNIINILARHTMAPLLERYSRLSDNGASPPGARIEYFELKHVENEAAVSLHSKVMLFGDALMVGSANADVRSLMSDTNNAVLILKAPELFRSYQSWVMGILQSPGRAVDLTQSLIDAHSPAKMTSSRAAAYQADRELLEGYVKQLKVDQHLSEKTLNNIKYRYYRFTRRLYELSRKVVETGNGPFDRKIHDEIERHNMQLHLF